MPIHDWTPVPAGLFHHFHQDWTVEIARTLNRGLLPAGLSALVEQRAGVVQPNVLAIEARGPVAEDKENGANRTGNKSDVASPGGIATADPPATLIVRRSDKQLYAGRSNRVAIRHHLGRRVAVIEIVSPGNKDSRAAVRDFVDKTIDLLRHSVHALIVDLLPPTPRDPSGIHKAIWDEIEEEDFCFPPGKDRVLVSHETGASQRVAYIEPVAVGDALPDMPLFVTLGRNVLVPLEATYQATWSGLPASLRLAVETGRLPSEDAD